MLLELLYPVGDAFYEPQALTFNLIVQKQILITIADSLSQTCLKAAETEAEVSERKRFLHRYLIFWGLVVRSVPDSITKIVLQRGEIVKQIDECFAKVDPELQDKHLQLEYLKFTKKLVECNDDDVRKKFLDCSRFLSIFSKYTCKVNMLSSTANSILESIIKVSRSSYNIILPRFVAENQELLDTLTSKSSRVSRLVEFHKQMSQNGSRQLEKPVQELVTVDNISDDGLLSAKGKEKRPQEEDDLRDYEEDKELLRRDEEEGQEKLNNLLMKMKKQRRKSEDEDDDDDGIFSHKLQSLKQSPPSPSIMLPSLYPLPPDDDNDELRDELS